MNKADDVLNWDLYDNDHMDKAYTEEEREELTNLYGSTLSNIHPYEIVEGTVISIAPRDIIVSIGYKSDGLIAASEFRDLPELKLRDKVEVNIEETDNAKGQIILS